MAVITSSELSIQYSQIDNRLLEIVLKLHGRMNLCNLYHIHLIIITKNMVDLMPHMLGITRITNTTARMA